MLPTLKIQAANAIRKCRNPPSLRISVDPNQHRRDAKGRKRRIAVCQSAERYQVRVSCALVAAPLSNRNAHRLFLNIDDDLHI
tara:strand:+ start:50884 stop:51132 length:249 start_codon:yes stop_codon:yes gene_type:complete